VSEGDQAAEQDFSSIGATQFDEVPFWRSGAIKTSRELLQDSGIDLEAFFAARFGIRFARGLGAKVVSSVKSGASVGKTDSHEQRDSCR
jgi:HK97 family phage major capsid protein